jgi:hypothetical protein
VIAAPPVELSVSPPRLVVAAGETRALRVTNLGTGSAVVGASVAGYRIALRGRPVVLAPTRSLELRPRRLSLAAGETATLAVTAPRDASPGDHPALVLVSRAPPGGRLGVRLRVGVLVLVRGTGRTVHRVVATALRRRGRSLELWLRNDGNVAERLTRETLRLRLPFAPRELLPHSTGVVLLRPARRLTAVVLRPPGARHRVRLRVR